MAKILVRDLSDDVVKRLKRRAKKGGRSLEAEVRMILEQTAQVDMETALALTGRIRSSFKRRRFKDSAALIREDRDR
jgi:plasmid stability protein